MTDEPSRYTLILRPKRGFHEFVLAEHYDALSARFRKLAEHVARRLIDSEFFWKTDGAPRPSGTFRVKGVEGRFESQEAAMDAAVEHVLQEIFPGEHQ